MHVLWKKEIQNILFLDLHHDTVFCENFAKAFIFFEI